MKKRYFLFIFILAACGVSQNKEASQAACKNG
jgi:hypothetical protein